MIGMDGYEPETKPEKDENVLTIRINYHLEILLERMMREMWRKIRNGVRKVRSRKNPR